MRIRAPVGDARHQDMLALRRVELPTARCRAGPTTLPAPAAASGGGGSGVRLVGKGESPLRVRAGQRASFTGRLVPNPPEHAQRVGMVPSEGAALGQRQGHHIEVAYADITLEP
jgi:hypothetical protein